MQIYLRICIHICIYVYLCMYTCIYRLAENHVFSRIKVLHTLDICKCSKVSLKATLHSQFSDEMTFENVYLSYPSHVLPPRDTPHC